MKRALGSFTAFLLLTGSSTASAADSQQAAMTSFLTSAISAAQAQFRQFGPDYRPALPPETVAIFGNRNCEVWSDEIDVPAGRLKLVCGPTPEGVFGTQTDFSTAVRSALPPGFTETSCPAKTNFAEQRFFSCLRGLSDVEIDLLVDTGLRRFKGKDRYALHVDAPIPQIDRQARQRSLAPPLAGIATAATTDFRGFDLERFGSRYRDVIASCESKKHPSGRDVLNCRTQNGTFADPTDFTTAVRAALPSGFAPSRCVQYVSSHATCLRRGGVEVAHNHFWPYVVDAYDASRADPRIARMKSFFVGAMKVAALNFRGLPSKNSMPYFGQCSLEKAGSQRYLSCVLAKAFEGDANYNDYEPVVRAALPPGYAAGACSLPKPDPEFGVVFACFRKPGSAEIELGQYESEEYWMKVLGVTK